MKKLVSLLLALAMLCSLPMALAESLEMSDIPGMTAPGVYPIVTEPVTLTIGLKPEGNVIDYNTNDFTLWIEEKTGIDLEIILLPASGDEAKQKIDLMIAAGEKLPDILFGNVSDPDYYGAMGVLVPMNEYFEKYAYEFNETMKLATPAEKTLIEQQMYFADGNIYGFLYPQISDGNNNENAFYINKNWLDKLGLEVPTTTDELYDVLVAFRDGDPNGNGKKDEIPMMGYNSTTTRGDVVGDLLNAFLYYPYNTATRLIVNDGVVTSAVINDAMKEGLAYCKKLYDEGLISELTFTQDATQMKAIIDRPNTEDTVVGVVATHPNSGVCGWGVGDPTHDKALEYTYMEPLTGPNGVRWAAQTATGMSANLFITKDCENPEVAFRFLDAFCNLEIGKTYRNGPRGKYWDWAEEGMLTSSGAQALMYTFDGVTVPWVMEAQNEIWRLEGLHFNITNTNSANIVSSDPYTAHRNGMFNAAIAARIGCQPEEVFLLPKYNSEELEVVNELNPMLQETANEWRTMFVMGEKDIEKDWAEYISVMEELGIHEVEAASQSCYDRMTGK